LAGGDDRPGGADPQNDEATDDTAR
jgi:hypothetical protein